MKMKTRGDGKRERKINSKRNEGQQLTKQEDKVKNESFFYPRMGHTNTHSHPGP